MSERTPVPWRIPAAGSPTARELRLVREWGQLAAKAVAQSLSGIGACPIACSLVRAAVMDQTEGYGAHSISLRWGAPGPEWDLRLSKAAAEDLLAGLLGYQGLEARNVWSRTDRALLTVQVAELAQRVCGDLQLPPSFAHEVTLPPDAAPSLPPLVVDMEMQLRVHDRAHELHLLTAFPEFRRYLDQSTSGGRAVTTGTMDRALIDLEAVLPGPELSAADLIALQVGDVLLLDEGQQEAVLRTRGVVIGRGRVGAKNGRLAVNLREVSNLP